MSSSDLPADVEAFMDFIGVNIKASGGLVWNERDRLKSDMMLVRQRWSPSRVSKEALRTKCEAVGMSDQETAKVVDWLQKTQSGRRLVPQHTKGFRWHQDPTP
ncbi:hypothetical protein OKJ48_04745 [Streptomyces kunmingensis]|uniref:Uncharacterized protein n=1 Tax=Streptomyces kunmingensis TaxID=68225 RepID=A0ABU6C4B5_9ACTN|nr:hypothetical protein [Streptomyces kunmingensis]MEB3959561.1 hypothetical protein [Streptomyces kunmingensis]